VLAQIRSRTISRLRCQSSNSNYFAAANSRLGGPKLAQAPRTAIETVEANADRHAANVLPIIREIQRAGARSLRAIAETLNARGVPTARGGRWQAMTVSNVLARA
jgi:hypothetical protein